MALRAGSVGLGREAGLGARRGWTRRRRPLPRPGPPPASPTALAASRAARARAPLLLGGRGETRGSPVGGSRVCVGRVAGVPDTRGGSAAAATLDASRALPVDRPSCGGRRGRARGGPAGGFPASRPPPPPGGGSVARAGLPPPGPPPGPRFFPRGASPRPAPSSRLRTGADQGNPTV